MSFLDALIFPHLVGNSYRKNVNNRFSGQLAGLTMPSFINGLGGFWLAGA
jgi:hypothetical protein